VVTRDAQDTGGDLEELVDELEDGVLRDILVALAKLLERGEARVLGDDLESSRKAVNTARTGLRRTAWP
jgi:hypothetical protein